MVKSLNSEIELLVIGPSDSTATAQVIDHLRYDPNVRVVLMDDIHIGMVDEMSLSKRLQDISKVYVGLSGHNLIPLQALQVMEAESKQELSRQEYFEYIDKINRKKSRRKY